jgi:hypothetical protein
MERLLRRNDEHHLEGTFPSQLKRRIKLVGKSLQEFAAAIDHLPHCAHIELPKHPISKEAGHAHTDGIRK